MALSHSAPDGEHMETELCALCPCGCCVECSLHTSLRSYPKPCASAAGVCPEGIMWTVDGYRVQKLESGDLVLTMLREYRFNPFWCTESMVGSTRFVRFKPGCKWGMYPDTHGVPSLSIKVQRS